MIDRGYSAEDTETFEVSPLIEKVLPPDRIAELAELIRAYAGAGPAASSGEPGEEPEDAEEEVGILDSVSGEVVRQAR